MMRLHTTSLESGAPPAAAGARLKKREEREMSRFAATGLYNNGVVESAENLPQSESDPEEESDNADCDDARSPEPTFGSNANLWHAASSEMSSSTWRDVIIGHGGGGGSEELPPLGSTVTPTPATSKRKKTKKEVFICHEPNCGKQFPRSFALRRHMRIHTGTKPYACDYDGCTQRFNTSGNLSRHKRIHSGERPYPCIFSTCGKKFNTSTKLKRHMRIHFPEGQNVFRCVGLNCAWSCDNYKEFAAHQKLQHNIIVGAGLEAVSAAAAAAIAAATGTVDHGTGGDRSPQYDHATEQGYNGSSNGYLYGYGKQASLTLPPPPSTQSSRKLGSSTTSTSSSSNSQFYDSGFSSLSGLSRDPKKSQQQQQDADHLYGDHHRRGSKPSNGYALPSSFPPADVAPHYGSRSGSSLSSLYESNSTLAISSESASYGAPLHRSGVFGHSLRHEEGAYKVDNEGNSSQYDHQPHPHASPAHHHILRPPPPSHHDHDGMKFSVPPPMNPAAPEFTGEELSVVLELMKDSYY